MELFPCPYLDSSVDLTEEREKHIAERHPELLPEYRDCIIQTLNDPDQVRRSKRFSNALSFSKWFENVRDGKFVVIVVITNDRNWIITAYICRKLSEGEIIWKKS